MTAQEMFDKLGWEKTKESLYIIVYEKGFRTISFLQHSEYEYAVSSSGHISIEMLKAINKQCQELGWIE